MNEWPAIDRTKYFERIKYQGETKATIEVLETLQNLHLLNVPFENLDIYAGIKINLENSYEKIVTKGRGGFCYELNGAFFQLLEDIGFDVKLISARVYNKDNDLGPEFDHMAIIATIDRTEYLVDVGFGDFAYSPLRINRGLIQSDKAGKFMIEGNENGYLSVGKIVDENFRPEYVFTEISRQMDDFLEMCNYHQTSSLSHFTQKRLCTIVTENGRVTISGNRLKKSENGTVAEIEFRDEEEFNKALWDYFRIKL